MVTHASHPRTLEGGQESEASLSCRAEPCLKGGEGGKAKQEFFFFLIYGYCEFPCIPCSGAHRCQKRGSDLLELKTQMIVSCHCGSWPQNRGLLREQKALLTSESPLRPKIRNSRDFSMNLETAKLHLSLRGLRWSPPALSQFRRLPPTSHPASPCFPPLSLYLTKCPGRAEQLPFSDKCVQTHHTVR